MSVKLLIAYFILLIPLDGVCDSGLPTTGTGTNTTSGPTTGTGTNTTTGPTTGTGTNTALGRVNHTYPTALSPTHFVYENNSKGKRDDRSSNSTLNSMDHSDSHPHYYNNFGRALIALVFSIPAVAALGVCGNVVVLVVWSAETAFNPTTFLMKCLAVSDIILLLFLAYNCTLVFTFIRTPSWMVDTVYGSVFVLFYLRMVTAHTTLGVVVTRWVAVNKPLRVQFLLTKRRVVTGYVFVLFWCLTPAVPAGLLLSGHIDDVYSLTILNICEGVYLVLPILLVMVLNVSLVYTLCSHRHSSSLGPRQQQHAARAARLSQLQQLVKAVLCLSVTTVLAYPVGVAYRVLMNTNKSMCSSDCRLMFLFVTIVLEEVNSSVNVIYYLLFISRFRQLYRRRCCCCWSR